MTVSVQEKIEQIKHKKYAYQWDIFLKAPASSVDTSFDRMISAFADIFDHLSSGPPIQRPVYLGKGGKDMYTIDFSLANAWGNGLFFHFAEPAGNPRDGYYANLWCEFVGIVDTRLFIEQSADVCSQAVGGKVMTVQPTTTLRISLATNQGWTWQEMMWHVIRDRLEKEGYEDETLQLISRVKLFDALREMGEKDVFEKLFETSKEKVIHGLNHPADYDRTYFTLRSDRYINIEETIQELKDPGRIRSLDISSLGLTDIPASIARFTHAKDVYVESNELKEFPESLITLVNTEKLFLSYNHLTSLPASLARLTKLHTLCITGNPIPIHEIEKIQLLLPNCHTYAEKSDFEKIIEPMAPKYTV